MVYSKKVIVGCTNGTLLNFELANTNSVKTYSLNIFITYILIKPCKLKLVAASGNLFFSRPATRFHENLRKQNVNSKKN